MGSDSYLLPRAFVTLDLTADQLRKSTIRIFVPIASPCVPLFLASACQEIKHTGMFVCG